ncbi:MAG: NADH-quinone oxidoreductase subunit A [Rubrobacteraceae bacterium]
MGSGQFVVLGGFLIVGLGVGALFMVFARLFRRPVEEPGKGEQFEGGKRPEGLAWIQFHPRYYTVALLFLAFDMEMAYMYPWAVVYRELGFMALMEMGMFLLILTLGIVYAWRERALDYS